MPVQNDASHAISPACNMSKWSGLRGSAARRMHAPNHTMRLLAVRTSFHVAGPAAIASKWRLLAGGIPGGINVVRNAKNAMRLVPCANSERGSRGALASTAVSMSFPLQRIRKQYPPRAHRNARASRGSHPLINKARRYFRFMVHRRSIYADTSNW